VQAHPSETLHGALCCCCPQKSLSLDVKEEAWRKEDLPLIEENQVRDPLSKVDTHKSMGPGAMHP